MPTKQVTFENQSGLQLAGVLELPDGSPQAYAILAHCFTCTRDYKIMRVVSKALAEQGVASLRFDFTGLGQSSGDFANTTFASNIADLLAAASWLEANHQPPGLLVGHSFGGAAVLHAANQITSCNALVTIAAVGDPGHVIRHMKSKLPEIQAQGAAEVMLSGRPFTITQQFLDSITDLPWQQTISNLGKALLVCHSPVDEIVSIENAKKIFQSARHPKSFLSLDDADHLFTMPGSAEYLAGVICAWARKYL